MRKVWVVARREYREAVQSKAFLVTLFLMPVLMGGSIAAQKLLEDQVDIADRNVAVIDRSGTIIDPLLAAAQNRNEQDIFDPPPGSGQPKQVRPKYLLEVVPLSDGEPNDQLLALSERVRSGELLGLFEIDGDVLAATHEEPAKSKMRYYSNTPTYDDFRRWLEEQTNHRIKALRLQEAGLDAAAVEKATAWSSVSSLGLVSRSATGEIKPAEESNRLATFFVAFIIVMLLFMVISTGAAPLINTVLEEKMQRISEVLLGAIPPFQLMLGKLLGSVGISATILTVYLIGGYFAAKKTGFEHMIPTSLLGWLVVYQFLAVLMYGSLFTAIGAACSELKEAQSALLPVWLLICVPLFVLGPIFEQPSSAFSVGMSLFPTATPLLMPMRQAIPPGVPLWQPLLGIVLSLATTLLCVWAAGRIFRVGILLQGKPPRLVEMLRWVVRG